MGGEAAPPRRVRVVHALRYFFEEPVTGADLVLRLTPRALAEQRVEHHQILVEPRPAATAADEDAFGNARLRVEIDVAFRALEVIAVSTVVRTDPGAALRDSAAARDTPGAACARGRATGSGRCARGGSRARPRGRWRGCAPRRRLPVRGRVRAPPSGSLGRRGRTLPHAWVSLWVPGHGWIELDPTRDQVAPGHVVLGWGQGYEDVAPISGDLSAIGRFRLTSTVTVEAPGCLTRA